MNIAEKLSLIGDAYEYRDVAGIEKIVLNEKSPLYEHVKEVQFELNELLHSFEAEYSIMNDACMALSEVDADEIENVDAYELSHDTASVYTATQLSWLNINNQADVADIVREYECDIGTACAVWYEQQVATAIEMLLSAVITNDEV